MGATMKMAAFLLIGCISYIDTNDCESTIIPPELSTLVKNSYNPDDEFKKNVVDILSFICPKSLFCEEDIPELLKNAENMLHNGTDSVNQSRRFLMENSTYFAGCCSVCSCKPNCRARNNCCSQRNFKDIHNSEQNQQFECVPSDMRSRFGSILGNAPAFYMVTACLSTYFVPYIKVKCEDPDVNFPDEIIPVHAENMENIYFNIYCALCNYVNITEDWEMRLIFKSKVQFKCLPEDMFDFYRTIIRHTMRSRANIIFSPRQPNRVAEIESCVSFHDICACPCLQSDKSNKTIEHVQTSRAYRNVFCWICQYLRHETDAYCSESKLINQQINGYITALIDFNDSIGSPWAKLEPLETSDKGCNCMEWYDKLQGICRPILCPVFERRVYCECRRWMTKVTGVDVDIRVTLSIPSGDTNELETGMLKTSSFLRHILSTLKTFIGTFHFSDSSFEAIHLCRSDCGQFLYFIFVLKSDVGSDVRDDAKIFYNQLMKNPLIAVKKTKFRVSLGPFYELDINGKVLISDGNATNCTYLMHEGTYEERMKSLNLERLTKLFYCKQVKVLPDELELLANVSAKFRSIDAHYFMSYLYDKSRSVMCLEDLMQFVNNVSNGILSTHAYSLTVVVFIILFHL